MKLIKYLFFTSSILFISCSEFLQIDPPKTSLVTKNVFGDDETATSAILGIYQSMAGIGYAGGSVNSITALAGLSADELDSYNANTREFYDNQVSSGSSILRSLYATPYLHILSANTILEGTSSSRSLSPSIKSQLEGEAYFIRAFAYFNLVNLFGSVPLQLTTDYRINRQTPLSDPEKIYLQIISDLKEAELLLTDSYPTVERVRPNLATVQAFLARVYLYQMDWVNAEKYAGLVIGKSTMYDLPSLETAFLKDSKEAIWQLFPTAGANTREGNLFILTAIPTNVALNGDFATNGFEAGDKRKDEWIRTFSNTTGNWYYPFKYKVKSSSTVSEYSIVFRLAEQYLIRAEARANQNNLDGAINDLDRIRSRAGLLLLNDVHPYITQQELLAAVQNERRAELFCEWGHRWYDLKRTGKAGLVLKPVKPDWQDTDIYYPLPDDEVIRNPNI